MSVGPIIASSAATQAAARRAALLREEEESMTPYDEKGLNESWEFKIVRSQTAMFRNPETMDRIVREEAQAGWELLEKFDDFRLRFKRRRNADNPIASDIDPYRTRVGITPAQGALLALAITTGLTVIILAITMALIQR